MKMKKKIMLLLAVCLVLLSGCGKDDKGAPASDEDRTQEESLAGEESEGEEAPDGEAAGEEAFGAPRELTNQELRDLTMWINTGDNYGNYGFLLSEYEKPQDVNLNEVFYTGAGLATKDLSAQEEAAYLKAVNEEEIYTDVTRLETAQINEFLKRKLGYSYEEMTYPLEWLYLPDYDIYLNQHGDSNYMHFTCVGGQQTGEDIYELDCVSGGEYDEFSISCHLTLKKNGADWQFVSNAFVEGLEYSMEIWKIDEQSFDVELDGWGAVTFNAYEPDKSMFGTWDAVFKLYRDGQEVFRFGDVLLDNFRERETFVQVCAVGFQDYNDDGYKDVIIITEYEPMINMAGGGNLLEVRLYRNRPDQKDFILDTDRMDYLNMNEYNHTVKEVLEHVNDASAA